MKLQAFLVFGLLIVGNAQAQMNNNQYHQQQQRIQNQNHAAEQNRLGYMTQQQQMQQQQLPPQPTGWWETTWGAIAPSPVGGVLGAAIGASSEKEAERLALEDCQAKGGGACQVLITYDNQCGVLIVGDKFLGTARANTKEMAENIGVEKCQASDTNCEVYYSACTEPVFHRY